MLDVRSPGEYVHAHFPGAHNLPLFTNEERKIVGTAYKQESREQAIKLGLEFFGPKMNKMIAETQAVTGNKQSSVLVYCWRGGMRSAGVAWLLDLYGFKVYTLIAGYKKFRNHVLETFRLPFQFNILGGYTGSGKTGLLKALKEKGQQVIDLEAIAKHKGSAFGNIGMPAQPSQEMFENLLACELNNQLTNPGSDDANGSSSSSKEMNPGSSIWLEDESQRIGHVNIPHEIWKTMRQSPVFFLDIPFEARLRKIVEEYGELDPGKLEGAIERISGKLGGLSAKNAISHLREGKKYECFEILLTYYDKFYFKALHNRDGINSLLKTIPCKSITSENANQLIQSIYYQPEDNRA